MSALRGDVEGMANDIAVAGLSMEGAIGVGTGRGCLLTPLDTCFMTKTEDETWVESHIAGLTGLQGTINNTCLNKHLRNSSVNCTRNQ